MSESPEAKTSRRWINFGEFVALAALIVSAIGVWIAWQSNSSDEPTRVVEQKQAIPLTLRGIAEHDGRELVLTPVESGHALESLTLAIAGSPPIDVGSDGRVSAGDVESIIKDPDRKGAGKVPVRINARYVEMGTEHRGGGAYVLRYRWEGGGLFGGRSLRLVGLSR